MDDAVQLMSVVMMMMMMIMMMVVIVWSSVAVELLRRDRSARLPVQRLVQPHQELRGSVRSTVVLRPAQQRSTSSRHQRRQPLPAGRHSVPDQSQLLSQVTGMHTSP